MRKLSTLVSMLVSCLVALAQQNDSLLLQEVTITSSRFEQFTTGIKTQTTDSVSGIAFRTQSLSDLLSTQSQVFIKSYGPALATSSFRGAGAVHTAVLWKGFNIQNPMLGETDFSLLNVDAADKVTIQYGGNGALFGSGAVGGIIQLQSRTNYNSGIHAAAGLQVGSFGAQRQHTSVSFGGRKWYSSLKWFNRSAQNNFTYTNTFLPERPLTRLSNAEIKQTGILSEHAIRLTSSQELTVNLWYQYADRNIPPTLSVPMQKAFQQDETYRITAEWTFKQHQVEWKARTAYFDERIRYQNPLNTLLNGDNHSKTSITEVESHIILNPHHSLNIGLNNTYAIAYSTGYGGWKDLNRTALFASYKIHDWLKNTTATLSVREEKMGNTLTPVMPSLGWEWRIKKGFKLFGNVSRSYRVPTLNERYWITGTTTNLQPETGWTEELSLTLNGHHKTTHVSSTLTFFNRTLQNWIVWQPAGSDWAPQNIKQVWTRGIEWTGNLRVFLGKLSLQYAPAANLILSTNTETTLPNDASLEKQLIYVPRVTQQHLVTALYNKTFLAYNHQYTGVRFTATDNSAWLNDYQLASLSSGTTFSWKKYELIWSIQVQNLYNLSYKAIADRPMPGRNFLTTITIKL